MPQGRMFMEVVGMSDVDLYCSMTYDARDEARFEPIQTWVAMKGEAYGIGSTKSQALMSLSQRMRTRSTLARTGDLESEEIQSLIERRIEETLDDFSERGGKKHWDR